MNCLMNNSRYEFMKKLLVTVNRRLYLQAPGLRQS
jgi:hypothetical protein